MPPSFSWNGQAFYTFSCALVFGTEQAALHATLNPYPLKFNPLLKASSRKAFPDDAPGANAVKLTSAGQWHNA